MSWYEQREEAAADFIRENQEYTEDDILERDEEINRLKKENEALKCQIKVLEDDIELLRNGM